VALVLVLGTLIGCAASKAYQHGERAMRAERYDEAVLDYSKATTLDPGNTRYTVALDRAKLESAADHFRKGRRYAENSQLELAVAEFQQVLVLAPGHQHAATELQRALREVERRRISASEIEQLKERARRRDVGPPLLDARTNIPILMSFKEVALSKIFEAIGKASGINFIFDDKVEIDKPLTIDIGNVTLEKALDILMLQTKNFYKVLDDFTLLIAPDTRPKRQEYEDQVIRTFFLSNADPKTVTTVLRSLLQSRQIAEDTELNSVTIKDTPAKVAIAERIVQAHDKSRGEVLIDVELLQINRNLAETLGIDLSSKLLSLQFRGGDERVPLNNLDILRQTGNWTVGIIPSVTLDFLKSDSDTKAIAQPQLRVSEGEQAQLLIGDRVPIPTTSFNTSQTVGGNIVPITSFTYQNVGITLQIQPRVHHNKEITLQVQVEISQVTGSVSTGTGGQEQPIIGTRQIQTVIRLRDNETNILAGLIAREDSDSVSGVAGIGDIPFLRRIFGKTTRTEKRTDIVMTITPRIIRIPDIDEEDLATLWVGTEENMQLRGPARQSLYAGPFGGGGGESAAEPPAEGAAEGDAAQREGGGLSRINGSQDVERERATGARGQPTAPGPQQAQPGQARPPVIPPPPPNGNEAEPQPEPPPGDEAEPETPPNEEEKPPEEEPGLAIVRLVPTKPLFAVGEHVVVQVVIDSAKNVGSAPFHLRYNPGVLKYRAPGTEGPFLRGDGANTVFLSSDTGSGGEIVVGLSRMGAAEGASGAGTLAVFEFDAIAPGDCGFQFTGASVKDPQARNLPAAFQTAPVRVQG
jgi:general secretion pathway protein D